MENHGRWCSVPFFVCLCSFAHHSIHQLSPVHYFILLLSLFSRSSLPQLCYISDVASPLFLSTNLSTRPHLFYLSLCPFINSLSIPQSIPSFLFLSVRVSFPFIAHPQVFIYLPTLSLLHTSAPVLLPLVSFIVIFKKDVKT